jgi:hypothetical protein
MPRTLQFKRYGSATLANTIGANGELIINQTNKTLTVHDGTTPGGFALLNAATDFDIDQYARNTANTTSNNITIIQGVNVTQNTNITNATNLAQAAYNYANTIVSDTQIDPYARTTANSASNNITIIQGVNDTQNTNITNATNLAQTAYDNSNTKYSSSGGTISGNVTISGILNVESTINVNNVLTVSTSPPAASPSITVIATQNHDLRLRAVSNTWTFRADGTTTFPSNITIDYSGNNVQFPRIIADSEKAFSIQGQGANGSAAMAWSIDHNADTQYAAVGVSRGGGDNLAKVILTAGNTTPTLKVWKFDQTGVFTLPDVPWNYEARTFTSVPVTYGATELTFTVLPNNTIINMSVAVGAGGYGPNSFNLVVPGTTFPGGTTPNNDITFNIQTFESPGPVYSTQTNSAVAYVSGTPPTRYDHIVSANSIGFSANNSKWTLGGDGNLTLPAGGDVVSNTGISQLANRVEGSWTLPNNTTDVYNFTVPMDGTYTMWVKGNIPNGIIIWNATVSVTNSNVPAIGTQYAWNYTGGGSPILLTAIPNQIRGTANTISTDATYAGTTSNRFDFTISNTSGAAQTVYYGYTKI